MLDDLGIVGKDGKINDDAMQEIMVCLKELLPPDLLKPLMSLKGRAFWDFVAEASATSLGVLNHGASATLVF